MTRVTGMVQARLGSKRLPGKVLLPFGKSTLLGRILIQLKAAKSFNTPFCLSTSDNSQDSELEAWANTQHILCHRSNVDDIVGRLHGSVELTNADILVRIWGDCPFISPDLIDSMVEDFIKRDLDFLCNSNLGVDTFPGGTDLEIYSRKLIERMSTQVTDPSLREFPVEFVRRNPDIRSGTFSDTENLTHLNLTVDYPEDLKAAEKLMFKISPEENPVTLKMLKQHYVCFPEDFDGFSTAPRNIEYQKFKELNKE
jgi:spore coat polysaccharide biosynthesis protein SpsF (cytidylyltransferase family)